MPKKLPTESPNSPDPPAESPKIPDAPDKTPWLFQHVPGKYDRIKLDPDVVMNRMHHVNVRAKAIWQALQLAEIPLSRFTHEALLLLAEQIDFTIIEEGLEVIDE